MAYAAKAFEYRKQAANNASPVGLVVMLYDGALQFMEAGKDAMSRHDLSTQSSNLVKAQKIVAHLMATLDMEKGGDVSRNLMSLYQFVYQKLIQANVHDQPQPIDDSISVFSELRESWSKLDEQLKAERMSELLAA